MSIEGFTGEIKQPAEFRRPVEQAPAIEKKWVTEKFSEWVKLNNEPAKPQISPEFKKIPSETRPFDVKDLEVKIRKPEKNAQNEQEKIISILFNKNIRRGDREMIDEPFITEKINSMTSAGKPIEIVLPALPSKNQNPLTTQHSLQEVDLGEYVLFAQLRNICASIENVYKPGAKITILTDGQIYAGLFSGGNKEEINQYRKNCEQIRDELGLQGKVDIIDLDSLIQNKQQLDQTQKQIKNILSESEGNTPEVREAMQSLQKSLVHIIPDDKNKYEEYASYISKPFEELPEVLKKRLHETALEYASIYLAMGKSNIAEKSFPNALRATVHRKEKSQQLPMRLTNRDTILFPWHGVPVLSESELKRTGNIHKETRIMRYGQMLTEPEVKAIYRPGHNEPFYYLKK